MSHAELQPPRHFGRRIELGVLAIVLVALGLSGVVLIDARQAAVLDPGPLHEGLARRAGDLALREAEQWMRAQDTQPVKELLPERPEGLWRRYDFGDGLYAQTLVHSARGGALRSERLELPGDARAAGWAWRLHCVVSLMHAGEEGAVLRQALAVELRSLRLHLPGHAALYVRDAGRLILDEGSVLSGGAEGSGLAFAQHERQAGARAAAVELRGKLDGRSDLAAVPAGRDGLMQVFGVSEDEILGLADIRFDAAGSHPARFAKDRLYVCRGPLRIGPGEGLLGGGVLVVLGDLELQPGNTTDFAGVVYVTGDLTLAAPAHIRGAVLCTGAARIHGDGDTCHLAFDRSLVRLQARNLVRYRRSAPPHLVPLPETE